MISEVVRDLVTKVSSVASLENSTGAALGGKGTDPGLVKLPLPAAWVMYAKDDVDEEPFGHGRGPGSVPGREVVLATCSVLIYVPYTTQDNLLDVQFPLIESVITTIRGTKGPSGHKWRYMGQKLALVYPDRLAYEQHYTLTAMV